MGNMLGLPEINDDSAASVHDGPTLFELLSTSNGRRNARSEFKT